MWIRPGGSDGEEPCRAAVDVGELVANLDRQVRALERLRDLGVLSVDEFRTHYGNLLAS